MAADCRLIVRVARGTRPSTLLTAVFQPASRGSRLLHRGVLTVGGLVRDFSSPSRPSAWIDGAPRSLESPVSGWVRRLVDTLPESDIELSDRRELDQFHQIRFVGETA